MHVQLKCLKNRMNDSHTYVAVIGVQMVLRRAILQTGRRMGTRSVCPRHRQVLEGLFPVGTRSVIEPEGAVWNNQCLLTAMQCLLTLLIFRHGPHMRRWFRKSTTMREIVTTSYIMEASGEEQEQQRGRLPLAHGGMIVAQQHQHQHQHHDIGGLTASVVVEHNYHDQYTVVATDEDERTQSSCPSIKRNFPEKLHYMLSKVDNHNHNCNNNTTATAAEQQAKAGGGGQDDDGDDGSVLDVESIVSWQPHGRCFLVHDQAAFVKRILPS